MATVNWQENTAFINNSNPLVQGVLTNCNEWLGFLDALGKVEGRNSYNTVNDSGYIGIYQFAPYTDAGSLFYDFDFSNNIGGMLDATTDAKYLANPIAQELSAIMEFSGNPQITKVYYSKYEYTRRSGILSTSKFDSMIGKTYTVQWVDENNQPIAGAVQTFKVTAAGISAGAHLVGQGGVASAMKEIYKQTQEGKSTVLLKINGGDNHYGDGSGIAFSTYMQLFQDFEISTLIYASNDLLSFNQLAHGVSQWGTSEPMGDVHKIIS